MSTVVKKKPRQPKPKASELQQTIKKLQKTITDLEERIDQLEDIVDDMKKHPGHYTAWFKIILLDHLPMLTSQLSYESLS